jgi:hypothetical protein
MAGARAHDVDHQHDRAGRPGHGLPPGARGGGTGWHGRPHSGGTAVGDAGRRSAGPRARRDRALPGRLHGSHVPRRVQRGGTGCRGAQRGDDRGTSDVGPRC